MTIATGIAKQVKYKVESTWGTVPSAGSSQALRRVSSDLDLKKETYESNELRTDYQVAVAARGSSGVGDDPRRAFAAYVPRLHRGCAAQGTGGDDGITGASVTIATSGSYWTITRAAGSFISDGIKTGDVRPLTVGSLNAANISKNLGVLNVNSATVLLVVPLNGVALVAEGPIATTTVTVIGKKVWTPTTGHTDLSYSIEHYYSDLTQSEVFSGCKVSTLAIGLPATGMATIDVGFMGKDITAASSEYFTSPTAQTTSGVLAAVNGVLRYSNATLATITGATINYDGGMKDKPVVGANTIPDIFEGRVRISGQLTALFDSVTLRDAFLNETAASFTVWLTTGSTAAADFLGFTIYNAKLGGATKSDGEDGLELTVPFTALYNSSGSGSDATTMMVQDSLAP
jgi:hypothetical protein